jgi:hypothetical protein
MTERWTKERVLEAIQTWHREGRLPTDIRTANPALERAARRHFGSWYNAQVAAGLNPRKYRRWTQESILQTLREAHQQGRALSAIWREDRCLCRSATRRFGSWQKALAAAGLQPYRREWSKAHVAEEIRIWQRQGWPLTRVWKDNNSLYTNAKRLFGTWRNALLMAGLEPKRKSWTRKAVIDALRASHDRGQPECELWRDVALSSAVGVYFGTRAEARKAAGLPSKPVRRWTRAAVVKALQARHDHGRSPSLTYKEDRALTSAAVRLFGSFRQALATAGLESTLRKWSPQRAIQELRARFPDGMARCTVWREDQPLALAAKKFGSRHNALLAAGLKLAPGQWSREQIIEAIQDGWVKRRPILILGLGDRTFARCASLVFGSWPAAVAAAGLAANYARTLAAPTAGTRTIPGKTA